MIKENYSKPKVMITETRTYKLWESAGRKLVEAQLTPDQIQQIFQGAQDIETGGGNNRTLIGKGKDAASAVGQAWEDLKTKAQNSKPIDGFEKKYDAVAQRLKQATGGDQGAMKYIQKYRDFAKKHPIAQGVIYAALIAAIGLSGAGVGGAAALGLFKMTDKLLQGDKFTSAAYSGAKTGALAYGASQLAQYFQNPKAPLPDNIDSVKLPNGTDYIVKKGDTLYLGPNSDGFIRDENHVIIEKSKVSNDNTNHNYYKVVVKNIHNNFKESVDCLYAGQSGCFNIKTNAKIVIKRKMIKKGMRLLSVINSVREFDAKIKILHNPSTITKKYQPTINCEGVSQSAQIVNMDKEYLRSFDEANVRFKFMYKPEFVECGALFLFREGLTKGVGKIINVY